MKKILRPMAFLTIALLIFSSVFLVNLFYWATNSSFYEKEQIEHNVSSVAGLSQQQINSINKSIISYLTLRTDNLNIKHITNNEVASVFSEKELIHMQDVRKLFIYGYIFLGTAILILATIIVKILIKKAYKCLTKITVVTPLVLVAITAVIITVVLIDFNYWFTIFHKISFTNDLWLLDPNTDILIQIMPLHFFTSMFTNITITSIISMILMMVIGYVSSRLLRNRYGY